MDPVLFEIQVAPKKPAGFPNASNGFVPSGCEATAASASNAFPSPGGPMSEPISDVAEALSCPARRRRGRRRVGNPNAPLQMGIADGGDPWNSVYSAIFQWNGRNGRAMGQSPNRLSPSEHPNPTTKMGSHE